MKKFRSLSEEKLLRKFFQQLSLLFSNMHHHFNIVCAQLELPYYIFYDFLCWLWTQSFRYELLVLFSAKENFQLWYTLSHSQASQKQHSENFRRTRWKGNQIFVEGNEMTFVRVCVFISRNFCEIHFPSPLPSPSTCGKASNALQMKTPSLKSKQESGIQLVD